ncbi:MAG: glycerate kinase [Methylobacter sp.]|uniref:glycerate kinase type-2 family protein n=1 Tax=Methylobacter sp. TaxID=2051955 RepID=UPI00272FD6DF|nr:glycerate kinase [Methylobacter sp.]MDP1667148.1 glycerate kinase [Methylobacter sp.]MDP1970709.1 glycerate kinase [Methylobacter sp.]
MSPLTDQADSASIRQDAFSVFQAGIAAADPYQAVKRHLVPKLFGSCSKVHLIAFGKAACAMAQAASEIIPPGMLAGRGIAVTNYENVTGIDNVDVIGASHPLPDAAGLNAAKIIAERVHNAQQNELVLVLVSGGGSALIPYPADQITLQEKIATTDLLLASGATINQINCVRKHLSRLKGGGLARLAAPARLHALILSDVLGDDLSAIASGPTVADPTTYADAIEILKAKGVWDQVPINVRGHLEQGKLGNIAETPKPGDDAFKNTGHTLIGSNSISVNAMLQAANNLGYETKLYSDHLCGEARAEAEKLVIHAKALTVSQPIALLAGGETTVTLKGNGRGGRNQEMALAFAIAAEQQGLTGNWAFLSGGTDGRDGPTDAAGGVVDRNTIQRMTQAGLNPIELLENNDSYTALKASDDLVNTGATGTNVADLQIVLIQPAP